MSHNVVSLLSLISSATLLGLVITSGLADSSNVPAYGLDRSTDQETDTHNAVFSFDKGSLSTVSGTYSAEFRVSWFKDSPDGFRRPILSINNQFPAPPIIVQRGDLINITVINEASDPTAIHWHGLRQRRTLQMDGVPGVTQCPILSHHSYVYTFSTSDQSGTYWYHSHFAMQYGDGLKGALVIKDPHDPWKDHYNSEEILQLTDWYHTPAYILLRPYLDPGTEDPNPDTGLVNGIGQFNCTSDKPCSYYRALLRANTTKRFRIINTSVYATFTLTINEHRMRVIEADGISLDGKRHRRSLRLTPGQRYSVLVTAKTKHAASYWIRATIHPFINYDGTYNTSTQPNVSAILQYTTDGMTHVPIIVPSMDTFNDDAKIIDRSIVDWKTFADERDLHPIDSKENQVPISSTVKTLIFNGQFQNGNSVGFYFNNGTFIHSTNTTLLALLLKKEPSVESPSVYPTVHHGHVIDVIINNIDFADHPFHLHGHHVWLLAAGKSGDGYVNKSTQANIVYNTVNPLYRDTFTVNPSSYLVFRFKADNPGIWMLHCHNDWHLQIGMALVFAESPQHVRNYYRNHPLPMNTISTCHMH